MKNAISRLIRLGGILSVSLPLGWAIFIRLRKNDDISKRATLLRESLEKLGSVFIKLGQMLALRPDVISDIYCNELYKLLDEVPSFPKSQVEQVIREELGHDTGKLFNEFDSTPVASASFAQVHKATLKNGTIVAVKVQRPNAKELVESDLSILRKIAWLVDILFRPSNKLSNIVEEFESWTKDELNYELEATNIEKFNEVEKLVKDGIRGPKVYRKFSTPRVLTMEYIDGFNLSHIIRSKKEKNSATLKELELLGFDGKDIVSHLIRNTLEMSHIHGFFHADPHPANIIFTRDKELVFIDFGIMGTLSKRERILILKYLRSMMTGNSTESFNTLITLCGVYSSDNLNAVKNEYDLLVKKITGTFDAKTYLEQQKQSGPILVESLNLLQRNGFKVPVSIVRYFKGFETIEGLIFALYPELQIKNMVKEFRRVSIMNIIDSLPESLEEKGLNKIVLKLIGSIEDGLLLKG